MPGGLDDLLGPGFVEKPLGAHAADDPSAADGDVAVLVGEEDGGADALVSATGGVGAVNPGQDRDAQFFQLRMPEKGGAVSAAVGVDLFLLGQLDAAAVDQPDQGDIEPFGHVGDPRMFSDCPAIQAPAITLLSKPIITHHLP